MQRGTIALLLSLLVLGPIWWSVATSAKGLSEGDGTRTFGRRLHGAIAITLLFLFALATIWTLGDKGMRFSRGSEPHYED